MDVARQFGANLRNERKQADLSQEELGFLAGLHRTEIDLLERGARVPRIDTLLKLTRALKTPPGRLIAGISWEPGRPSEVGSFAISSAHLDVGDGS